MNFDGLFSRVLIKAIKSCPYKNIADPGIHDTVDPENSSPDNGVEPVSIISHIAEQEHSFSDDTTVTASPTSALDGPNPVLGDGPNPVFGDCPNPVFGERVEVYMDDTEDDSESIYDNNEIGTLSVVIDETKPRSETSV